MDLEIAIPSYQRPELCKNLTLTFLKLNQYPADLITVFVASEEEKLAYEKNIARLKDPMMDIGSPEYVSAQKEIYKIVSRKYKEHGLEAPSYADYVSQEAPTKPKKPGIMERMFGPSNPPPVTPGVKFLGFE